MANFLDTVLLKKESSYIVRGWGGDARGLLQVRGSVAPFLDDGLLDNAWVCFAVDTNLLGNFDTVGLGNQSGKIQNYDFQRN